MGGTSQYRKYTSERVVPSTRDEGEGIPGWLLAKIRIKVALDKVWERLEGYKLEVNEKRKVMLDIVCLEHRAKTNGKECQKHVECPLGRKCPQHILDICSGRKVKRVNQRQWLQDWE
jgi:hypothetical protein